MRGAVDSGTSRVEPATSERFDDVATLLGGGGVDDQGGRVPRVLVRRALTPGHSARRRRSMALGDDDVPSTVEEW